MFRIKNPNYIPPNNDPFYPDAYHIADHTLDCTCDENEEECRYHMYDESCPYCKRPDQLCKCP